MYGSTSSSDTILKDATGVEPGCVEIIPRNLVTLHVRTWLYSLHTDTRNFSDKVTCNNSKCVIHIYPCWYTILRQKSFWNENYQILMLFNIQCMNPIVKPSRCTSVSNLFILEWHSTCFRRSFHPSLGVQDCTYSSRHLSLYSSKQTAVSVWQMPVAVCTVLNSWWWMERQSETRTVQF